MKISTLSKEQWNRLPVFRQEWLDIGLSCQPADFATAEAAITEFYRRVQKPKPLFLKFASPFSCELASQLLSGLVCDWPGGQLRVQLGDQLWRQLGDQLRRQLWDQLWDQLGDQLRDQLRDQQCMFYDTPFWGQFDAVFLAYYRFCQEIGVKYAAEDAVMLDQWGAISKSCGWWKPFDSICIISDRPRHISFDDQGRLHHDTQLAIEFSDGWGVAAWHGQHVPREWILDRSSLSPALALGQQNAELRRVACEILGWARVLETLNPRMIDEDEPAIGSLVEVDLPVAPRQWFLRYRCATGRWFAEPVVDHRYNTALLANAAGNGWRPETGDDPMSYIPFIRT